MSKVKLKQITGDTPGSIPFLDSNGVVVEDNNNLFWDSVNLRLGVGTNSPTQDLHISGSIRIQGGAIYDNNNTSGASGQIIQSTGTGFTWEDNIADSANNLIIQGKNMETTTIAKGTPLYFSDSGASGNIVGVYKADASNPNRMPAGGVAGESLTAGQEGDVFIYGFISGVDTSLFTPGDDVFVGVGGGYTNTKPTGTALIQKLGNVEKVHASNGSGVIQGPSWYNDLPNWEEGKVKVGISNGQPITSSVVHLDESNERLGIGTNSPESQFDVQSTTRGSTPLPRMTEAQKNAISSPVVGESVYQTDGEIGVWSYNGTSWVVVGKEPEYATVGTTGAEYTTIQAAVDDGKEKIKLITDITTSADVTLPTDYCLTIDLNTKIATFAADVQILGGHSVEVIDNTGYRKGEVRFSSSSGSGSYEVITATYSECRGIVVKNETNTFFAFMDICQFCKKHIDSEIYTATCLNGQINCFDYVEDSDIIGRADNISIAFNSIVKNSVFKGEFGVSPSFLGVFDKLINCEFVDITTVSKIIATDAINVLYPNDNTVSSIFPSIEIYRYGENLNIRYNIDVLGNNAIVKNSRCNILTNNGDNNNFDTVICSSNVINNASADKCVFRNIQYTGTATDNGTNTRVWEVFQN